MNPCNGWAGNPGLARVLRQVALDAGSIVNSATGAAQDETGAPVTSSEDTETINAVATTTLALDKTATPSTYGAVGEVTNYDYVLTNNGNVTISQPYSVTDDKVGVTCPADPVILAPGAMVTCTASHTITQADLDAGEIVNLATATVYDTPQPGQTVLLWFPTRIPQQLPCITWAGDATGSLA